MASTNARSPGGLFVVHIDALHGNPYDGHTLNYVMVGDGSPISRDLIADSLGYDRTQFLKGIESILARLRRKVQTVAGMSLPVKPVRGIGYVFAEHIA